MCTWCANRESTKRKQKSPLRMVDETRIETRSSSRWWVGGWGASGSLQPSSDTGLAKIRTLRCVPLLRAVS